MVKALLLALVVTGAGERAGGPLEDHVDLIEVNHCFDRTGAYTFSQIIFYDWDSRACRYQVRDWRMLQKESQRPRYNHRDRRYEALWHDAGERDAPRFTTSKAFRETWTCYDPELRERDFLPNAKRRDLTDPQVFKYPNNFDLRPMRFGWPLEGH